MVFSAWTNSYSSTSILCSYVRFIFAGFTGDFCAIESYYAKEAGASVVYPKLRYGIRLLIA